MTELPTEAIETPRLHLEPLRIEDAAEMTAVLSDSRLYIFIGGRPPTRSELTDQYTRQVVGRSPDGAERWLNWIIREADTRTATGYVQASVVGEPAADGARVAYVAWVVGSGHQGRGFAVEAATAMAGWLRSGCRLTNKPALRGRASPSEMPANNGSSTGSSGSHHPRRAAPVRCVNAPDGGSTSCQLCRSSARPGSVSRGRYSPRLTRTRSALRTHPRRAAHDGNS